MSLLFAAAGGLIEAQDEALAGALSKAAEEPAGLQSLGLIHNASEGFVLEDACVMGGYGRVGPEDVSDSPLERIATCAQALQPEQFGEIAERATTVSQVLESAASQLQSDLNNVLGSGWQGEFATSAQDAVRGLVTSAQALSGELGKVAEKAQRAREGFAVTRTNIAEQALQAKVAELSGREAGPAGPAGLSAAAQAQAQRLEAEEQARAIVKTEYSPAVMDANLDDLDFTSAYRVVATSALGGPNGVDLARIWNTDGIPRPAQPATPSPAALAAMAGGGEGAGAQTGGQADVGAVAAAVGQPIAPTDAATEQALLAARSGAADGVTSGAGGASAGQAGAGGGVNAATTAAGAPIAPMTGTTGQQTGGAGAGGIRGLRGGTSDQNRGRDRGFASTAGMVGGGGAAAAGAGASRMGGAGTLAGYGAGGPAGPGAGGPPAGAPGAGSAPGAGAGSGAGTLGSSSSTSGANAARAGAMPMGGMMGAAGAGQNSDRRGHTPAGYLTNATNTTAIIGEPVKVAPAVLGRATPEPTPEDEANEGTPYRGRTLGRDYTGGGAKGR